MRLICHKHNDEEFVAICPKCNEIRILEEVVKEIRKEIDNSKANFEWINGMLETINIVKKRIQNLEE